MTAAGDPCNMAAAEFLLPTGALGQVSNLMPSIDTVLDLRKRFEASAEAALLRIRRLTTEPALAFACHRGRLVLAMWLSMRFPPQA